MLPVANGRNGLVGRRGARSAVKREEKRGPYRKFRLEQILDHPEDLRGKCLELDAHAGRPPRVPGGPRPDHATEGRDAGAVWEAEDQLDGAPGRGEVLGLQEDPSPTDVQGLYVKDPVAEEPYERAAIPAGE